MVTEFLEPGGTRSDLSEVIPLLKKPESPHGCFILMYDKIHYKKKKARESSGHRWWSNGGDSNAGMQTWVRSLAWDLKISYCCCCCCLVAQSCLTLFVIPWTIAHQASLSIEFPRQEYWSGLPCPPPGVLPHSGIEPVSPALAGRSLTAELLGKP